MLRKKIIVRMRNENRTWVMVKNRNMTNLVRWTKNKSKKKFMDTRVLRYFTTIVLPWIIFLYFLL